MTRRLLAAIAWCWLCGFLHGQVTSTEQQAERDGRATAEQRANAGTGAAVKELPAAGTLSRKQQLARLDRWRETIRQQLFVPKELPELDAKLWSTFSPTPGVLADRVTYATGDGMVVPAIVYRPDPTVTKWRGRLPAIVIVAGHGGDKFSWYAFYSGMLLAKAGAMVLTYDLIGEGERDAEAQSRTGESDLWVSPPAALPRTDWGQRLCGLMEMDLLQAVTYLAERAEVDPQRIGVVAYSMGGFLAGIDGAVDPRVHALLISGGGVYDGPGGYFDSNPLPVQTSAYKALLPLGDRGAVLYALNAERGPMLVMNGSQDTVMDIAHHPPGWFDEERARAKRLLRPGSAASANLFTTFVYPGVSHRTNWVEREGLQWLNAQLHFAVWNEQTIAGMATTHVSDWAKANDVYLSESYAKEDREGGLNALGTGLPGLQRDDLTIIPKQDWRVWKDRTSYAAWAEKAKAAEANAASAR